MISVEKLNALSVRLKRLLIRDEDLTVKFILGSGKGGQKINKTASTVYIKHEPTGIEVKCGKSRSRELNRYYAFQLLCEKLEKKLLGEKTKREQEAAKIKRQKKRRSQKAQQKVLEGKKQLSEKKQFRKHPSCNHE
ncbi:MAG: peptide chain release factor family protein [Chlamydiales bacterium]